MLVIGVAIVVGALLVLSLFAKERNYLLTSASLMAASSALATWCLTVYWMYG
jgi:hypothetical protein